MISENTPKYYRILDTDYDIFDLASSLNMSFTLGCVLKYITRAGQKEGNSYEKDLKKALDCLQRELGEYPNNDFEKEPPKKPERSPLRYGKEDEIPKPKPHDLSKCEIKSEIDDGPIFSYGTCPLCKKGVLFIQKYGDHPYLKNEIIFKCSFCKEILSKV